MATLTRQTASMSLNSAPKAWQLPLYLAAGTTLTALASWIMPLAPAYAGTATGSLGVTATVSANCIIDSGSLTLAFGAYDPVQANLSTAATGSTGLTVYCTKGATPTSIDLSDGANVSGGVRRMANGTDYLEYDLYKDSGRTSRWGAGATNGLVPDVSASATTALTVGGSAINIYGKIPAGQNTVPAGTYSDTVNITVNF